MKRKSKPRGITFFLAICASVFSASFCVLLIAGEYQSAHSKLDRYNREFQGWQACQQTKPAYFKDNKEAVSSCIRGLYKARNNFWVTLPKVQLAGLFVLAALGSALCGYLAARLVVWFGGLAFYRFFRWLALCFRRLPERKGPLSNRMA